MRIERTCTRIENESESESTTSFENGLNSVDVSFTSRSYEEHRHRLQENLQETPDGVEGDMLVKGCAGFSFVGFLFLTFIGQLIKSQPLYVDGLHKRPGSQQTQEGFDDEGTRFDDTAATASSNAFRAATAHLVTVVLCVSYLKWKGRLWEWWQVRWRTWWQGCRRRRRERGWYNEEVELGETDTARVGKLA